MRETLDATSLLDCAAKCQQRSFCSFGQTSSRNCLLSPLEARDVRINEDLVSDQYWVVYRIKDSGNCQSQSTDSPETDQDCYRKERSGYKYYNAVVREAIITENPELCSEECHKASYCQSFSYTQKSYYGIKNCYLSELNVGSVKQNLDLIQDADWSLYESLDGRDCVGSNGQDSSEAR